MASEYWSKFARRRVSRRSVLKAGAAAGLGAAALGAAACEGDGEEGTPAGGETPAAGETPVPGGKATFGIPTDPGNLDPQQSITAGYLSARIHNPLHAINMSTQEFTPLIAEKLEQPDNTTYIWTLRKGVKFHDVDPTFGREVTAEDVKYSFDRLKAGPTLNDRKLLTLYTETYEAVDTYTFKHATNRLFSPAIYHHGNYPYCIVPREAVEKWEDLSSHASGCGAWILDGFTRGERVRLRKNLDYYLAGRPFPDEEEWLVIPDTGTLWQTFKTGKLDYVAVNLDKFKRAEVEGNPSYQVETSPSLFTTNCYIRVDRPPFSDDRVREALDIAIDRDDLIDKLYFGEGKYNGPVPWPLEYWALPQDEIRTVLKYDAEKATQLLSAAGYGDGLELNAPCVNFGDPPKAAEIVADHYRRIGVRMNIALKELGVYLSQYQYPGEFDITFFLNLPYMEPDMPLRSYYSKGQNADRNPGRSSDSEVDALIEGGWEIFDIDERQEYYRDVQRVLLRKHGPMYPLCSPEGHVGYSARMRGLQEGTGLIGWLGISYWVQ
ncbi:MAG: ABC transporter substrate-binding protein [Dehalococcoidia bacterium]|nr:ABC transporter substrate-binding protein [Dehalococcoidia bacterium]